MADALTLSLLVIGLFSVFCWALACIFRDASIADLFWPLYHAIAATTYLYLASAKEVSALTVVFSLLICLWASRLFLHLFFRRLGQEEDHRYAAIRERNPEHFWWQSFFTIFLMQSGLAWLICAPFSHVILNAQSFSVLPGLGLFFMAFGLMYEWVADHQLKNYLRKDYTDNGEKPDVLAKGLWKFSRHPNYFGDWTFWLGTTIVAISAGGPWVWLAVLNVFIIYWLLTRFTGVARAEQTLPIRRPGYKHYIETTPAFFPSFLYSPFATGTRKGRSLNFAVALLTLFALSSPQISYGDTDNSYESVETEVWEFDAFVGKKRIGAHRFEVMKTRDQITAKSSASFEYDVFKIPLLKYEHSVVEIYNSDSCLKSISSETTSNSKRMRVTGEKKGDSFFVTGNTEATFERACLMPFAYWSPKLLDQTALINGQTGKITPIKILSVDSPDSGKNYVLSGKDLNIELAYSSENKWTGLQSKLPLGRTLKYTLVSYQRSAPELVSLNINRN
jgi:steroid 5-alpha reductase family enzyme